MEEINNQPPEEKEIEAPDMINTLRDESQQTDSIINSPTIIDADNKQESLSLKLPSGFELTISSVRFDVVELANISIGLYEKFMLQNKKTNGISYVG